MTHLWSSLLLLAGIYLAALASPGPNFFILSQMSLGGRRSDARRVAYGIATGSLVWVLLALAGVSTLLARFPALATAVRVGGALYLAWFGARLLHAAWRHAPMRVASVDDAARRDGPSGWRAFRVGFVTCLTNPKGAAFWTGVFAAVVPHEAPAWFLVATVGLVVAMSLAWHVGITGVFGVERLRSAYLRVRRIIDATAGTSLLLFGLHRLAGR